MPVPQPGQRINNYLLEELVGCGSFGQVWRAKHHMFDELVAIKIPTDADYVQNLRREGVTIHGLRHPNIVRAIDLDPFSDPPYLIMEFVPGDTLRTAIDAHPQGMPIDSAETVMRGMLRALETAHEAGVIHRDVKPANTLLCVSSERIGQVREEDVKVADFGLGRVGGLTAQSILQSGSDANPGMAGTIAYMAPEQRESGESDGRSDLYSCGIVLFEMLTGKRPHGAEVPSNLRPEVPGRLDEVFRRCYARRERRYANAAEMLAGLSSNAPPPVPPQAPVSSSVCCSCSKPVERGDQFCIHCGSQMVESVPRCDRCRAYVHGTDFFCIHCGKDLRVGIV